MRDKLHTPWSDEIDLLVFPDNQDAEGYGVGEPLRRTLMCTFEDGTSQNEFYLSQKSGLQASASVELWYVDYEGEKFADFHRKLYRVIRTFRSSFDAVTLILSEVVR